MYARVGSSISREAEDIIIADAALTISFAFIMARGLGGATSAFSAFFYLLPISFAGVTLSFVLHELMHKYVAQSFGAAAAFRRSDTGIVLTLVTGFLGFLVGLPGATMIYASHFTRREEGYVSLAGPLTNFAVFAVFFVIGNALFPSFAQNVTNIFSLTVSSLRSSYLQSAFDFVVFISIYLAFFNMLPMFPLDGSKVYRWNKVVYFTVVAVILLLLVLITGFELVPGLVFILIVALLISSFYRALLF